MEVGDYIHLRGAVLGGNMVGFLNTVVTYMEKDRIVVSRGLSIYTPNIDVSRSHIIEKNAPKKPLVGGGILDYAMNFLQEPSIKIVIAERGIDNAREMFEPGFFFTEPDWPVVIFLLRASILHKHDVGLGIFQDHLFLRDPQMGDIKLREFLIKNWIGDRHKRLDLKTLNQFMRSKGITRIHLQQAARIIEASGGVIPFADDCEFMLSNPN
ncbi:MAG: hypothetical protein HYY62_01575 [Deltaproteobacteria bacterium]|nr:hypothetical protein [Deltaproteobacteria bacterium]